MTNKTIQVMHLITGLNAGGAEKAVLDMCSAQNRSGIQATVVSLTNSDKLVPQFTKEGIEVYFLNLEKDVFSYIKAVFRLSLLIREKKSNILHCHLFHPTILAYFIKFLNPRIKLVFTSHSFNIGSRFREGITRLAKGLRNADIVFSSNMITRIYNSRHIHIIPNGIRFEHYNQHAEKNRRFTFINVARLEEVKNHKVLVEAAARIEEQYEFEIWLVGDGNLKQALTEQIQSLHQEERVKLMGYSSDVPMLLCKCHCFILTSLWEGLPISILEACAAGLPIISTPVGSIPEIFSETEILFSEADPASIAHKMIEIMDNYEFYTDQADKLKKKSREKFELQTIAERHTTLYYSILQ